METEEFNHMVVRMRGGLKTYALKLTGTDDNAEDLVQEVLLRLWGMRSQIRAGDNLVPLAMTIMRNKHLDQCRHERRIVTTERMEEKAMERNEVEQRDEEALIGRIVEHLPPLQRQVFRMKEIEGYTVEEIMRITGCTADNLYKNLSRARIKIRETYIAQVKSKKGGF